MSNIEKVNENFVDKSTASNRTIELRNIMLSLIKFDIPTLDTAKVIYFSKKDCPTPDVWFSVVVDGLGLLRTHPEAKFNVKVSAATYSKELQKYQIFEHKIRNIKGRSIAAYCYNNFKDVNISDFIRIDATTASRFGTQYSTSCVFVRNDLES